MTITVEYRVEDGVEIHCDHDGLDLLIRRLQILRERGGHEHLMTPSWAGNELTEDLRGTNTSVVHHLLIVLEAR